MVGVLRVCTCVALCVFDSPCTRAQPCYNRTVQKSLSGAIYAFVDEGGGGCRPTEARAAAAGAMPVEVFLKDGRTIAGRVS